MSIWVRKFLRYIFGLEAVFLAPALLFTVFNLVRAHLSLSGDVLGLLIGSTGATLLGVLFAFAWWFIGKNGKHVRFWGISTSAINILLSVPLVVYVHVIHVGIFWIAPASGLIGLWEFSRKSGQEMLIRSTPAPRSLRGDGTSQFLNKIAPWIAFIGAGGSFFWWLRWVRSNDVPTSNGVILWLGLLMTTLFVTLVHELGHAVTGYGLGMKLRSFVVGPFRWNKYDGKWTFQFNLAGMLSAEGYIGVVPTSSENRRWRDIAVYAAGPLANLLMAGLTLGVAFSQDGDSPTTLTGWLVLIGMSNVVTGLLNFIPIHTGSNYSDGAKIYQLLSRGPFADLHLALSVATSSLVTPLRPRDYDMQSIERASNGAAQGTQLILLKLLEYQHFLDSNQLPDARTALANAESVYHQHASDVPAALHYGFVFATAYLNRDAIQARRWWDRMQAKAPTRFNGDYWLAHSALHWIEGNQPVAEESWQKGNAMALQLPYAGAYEFDRYCFSLLRQALDETSPIQYKRLEFAENEASLVLLPLKLG